MSGITITADSSTQFETGAAEYNSSCRLDDNTFVVAYRDNSDFNFGKAIVGTRSGTVITISEVNAVTFASRDIQDITVRALSSTKIIISYYSDVTNHAYAIVGTISGVSITFGTELDLGDDNGTVTVAVLDSSNVVFSICDAAQDDIDCWVGSISGTTISIGSVQTLPGSNPFDGEQIASVGLDSTHCVIAFIADAGNDLYAVVTLVNTGAQTLTFGNSIEIMTAGPIESFQVSIDKFDSTHFIAGAGDQGSFSVVACSYDTGTLAITNGSKIEAIANDDSTSHSLCTMGASNFLVAWYATTVGTQGEVRSGTLTGSTTITWDAQGAQVFDTSTSAYTTLCRLTDNYFLLGYKKG